MLEDEYTARLKEVMMKIPNIIDESVPIGKDDSENVEVEKFGEPVTPDFEIPYHTDIMALFDGIDKDAAGRVAGEGFYYLMGDIVPPTEEHMQMLRQVCEQEGLRAKIGG